MTGFLCVLPFAATLFTACAEPGPLATGYVEGDFTLIAPVATAQVRSIAVASGDTVAEGAPLVAMERRDAEIALAQTEAALAEAGSRLMDLQEGKRPAEIQAIEATLASARAQSEDAARTEQRMVSLASRGAVTESQRDDAVTAAKVADAQVAQIEAELAVARLPARAHEIASRDADAAAVRRLTPELRRQGSFVLALDSSEDDSLKHLVEKRAEKLQGETTERSECASTVRIRCSTPRASRRGLLSLSTATSSSPCP